MASTRPPVNLTSAFVSRASADCNKQVIFRDRDLRGFALRVTPGGAKAFVVEKRIKGRVRRITIGSHPALSASEARKQALVLLGEIACGRDPIAERAKQAVAMKSLIEVYRDFIAHRQLKPNTLRDYERAVDGAFGDWRARPIAQITEEMVIQRYAGLSELGHASASRHMRFLRALFGFANARYKDQHGNPVLKENPVLVLTKLKLWHRPNRRRTYIAESDLPFWFSAVLDRRDAAKSSFVEASMDYMQFLILTGLRREEAAKLKWGEVDLSNRIFTVTDTKNHLDHVLPLSDYLADLLLERSMKRSCAFVFPGQGKKGHVVNLSSQINAVTRKSGVSFCLHDLRRTFTSAADSIDLPDRVIKRLVNHSPPTDVTSGYVVNGVNRLRDPMQRVTDYILGHARVRTNVIELKPRAKTASSI
jgi:integrase